MKIIGVTGGIGSGKSTVSLEFQKLGATVVDADAISRNVTLKGANAYFEIVEAFGEDILLDSGELNRKKLAEIVFSNKDKLNLLNKITHKHIFDEMRKQIETAKTDVVVLDVPLLFSCDFPIKCDLKIAVIADKALRIQRVKMRSGLSTEEIEERIQNQLTDEDFIKLADICIVNDDLTETRKQVEKIYERM